MSDKFDYFICMMLRDGKLPVENLAEPNLPTKKTKKDAQFGAKVNISNDNDPLDLVADQERKEVIN